MSNIIVNTNDDQYLRVTNNKGLIGIGTPYTQNPENQTEIIVPLTSIQQKRNRLQDRLNLTLNAGPGALRNIWNYGGGDDQEDKLVDQFERFLYDVLYQSPGDSTTARTIPLQFFPYTAGPFTTIGQSRDYTNRIMQDWIDLLNNIVNKKPGLAREQPVPPPPPPVRWTDCTTGMRMTTNPPDGWMQIPYSGSEGGFCLEPVLISVNSSSVSFVYDRYTQQYPQPITYRFTNTSTDKSYRVNLSTDETLFTVNPTVISLVPQQSASITVALPPQNVSRFAPGVTNFRLQTNISKLR